MLKSMSKFVLYPFQSDKPLDGHDDETSYTSALRIFDKYYDSFMFTVLPLVGVVVSCLLIYAIKKRSGKLYVPFMAFLVS